MSRIRSRPLLALSVALIATSVSLGALMVHDGEVGDDGPRIAQAAPGEKVHLKGVLAPVADGDRAALAPWPANGTYRLAGGLDATVLVTGVPEAPEGIQVITGTVAWSGPLPGDRARTLVVVELDRMTSPVLFG